ncbi:MAG TPA: hypothetical protein VE487_08060 [Ilumatobacter sp.]|nr:hypothetical protein [Ilumatobacter sp.]
MTSEIDEFRSSLVAAVQAELERHASAVVAEVDRLREEDKKARNSMRAELNDQLKALGAAVEQMNVRHEVTLEKQRAAFDQRLTESEARQTRRIDDMAASLEGLARAAAAPLMQEMRDEQEALIRKVDALDANLRKFDEQAARMVTYFNDVSQSMEARQDELSEQLKVDIAARLDTVQTLVEDNDANIRRFQAEVGQTTSQKINEAEDRFNNRLLAAESRMKEDAGQKIAEIDAHVGRVSAGLDETMLVLNDRIAGVDSRFVEADRRMDGIEESIEGVDAKSIDELKEKMSTAVGEAMLVRFDMERLEKATNERTDSLSIRMTDVETQVQDATMDVSTSVQLDRLEEIERTLIELDPAQFVRKDELDNQNTVKNSSADADAVSDGAVTTADFADDMYRTSNAE